MATKITQLIAGVLDPTNSSFLNEWNGRGFVYNGTKYTVRSDGVYAEPWNENIPNQDVVMFDPARGLNPYWKGSFKTEEAFKFYTPQAKQAAGIATSNFGQGSGSSSSSGQIYRAEYKGDKKIGAQVFVGTREEIIQQATNFNGGGANGINPANLYLATGGGAEKKFMEATAPGGSASSGGSGGGTAGTGGAGGTGGGSGDITAPPQNVAFKDTAAYKALSQQEKDFVDIAYNLISVGGENEAKIFSNAIKQAQAIADPYFKAQLGLALAEVQGKIAETTGDFTTKQTAIKTARDQLLQDVSASKDFLTVEQQAEIAKQVKAYDEDLLAIADQAAEKGLTFATGARSRALAEERRAGQQQDVIQSSQRQYNFKIKELELKASRGDAAAQAELDALQSKQGYTLQGIGRAAEEVLGSGNLPAITGYTPTGGVTGKLKEENIKSTLQDVAGFTKLQQGFV